MRKEVEIEASSAQEAERKAVDMYKLGHVVLSGDDFAYENIEIITSY